MHPPRHFIVGLCAAFVYLYASIPSAVSAELFMYRSKLCPWCKVWDKQVGVLYNKTDVGQNLPLRMVDFYRPPKELSFIKNVRFTPTFVLVHDRKEVGRIQGYPGEGFFWAELERLFSKVQKEHTKSDWKLIWAWQRN